MLGREGHLKRKHWPWEEKGRQIEGPNNETLLDKGHKPSSGMLALPQFLSEPAPHR